MKTLKKLLIATLAMLPVVSMLTAVAAHAWPGGGSWWGVWEPEYPQD